MLNIPNPICPSDHGSRENANAHSIRMSASFDKLDQQTQRIVSSLLESNRTVSREITTALSQLMRRLEIFNQDGHIHTRDGKTGLPSIIARVEMLAVSQPEETKLRTLVQETILKNLRYPTMPNRYEAVVDAHPNTFEWAF
jgi:hypothetical protein